MLFGLRIGTQYLEYWFGASHLDINRGCFYLQNTMPHFSVYSQVRYPQKFIHFKVWKEKQATSRGFLVSLFFYGFEAGPSIKRLSRPRTRFGQCMEVPHRSEPEENDTTTWTLAGNLNFEMLIVLSADAVGIRETSVHFASSKQPSGRLFIGNSLGNWKVLKALRIDRWPSIPNHFRPVFLSFWWS